MSHRPESPTPQTPLEQAPEELDYAERLGRIAVENMTVGPEGRTITHPEGHFTVQLLGTEVEKSPRPIAAVLPRKESWPGRFAEAFLSGNLPIEPVEDAWDSIKDRISAFYAPMTEQEYAEAVAANRAAAGLSGDAREAALAGQEPRLTAVAEQFKEQDEVLGRIYIDLLEDVEGPDELSTILEAYEFTITPVKGQRGFEDHSLIIANCADTPMDPGELCKFAEALYLIANVSHGRIAQYADVLAFLSADHSSMTTWFTRKDGTVKRLPRNGYQSENSMVLSERRLAAFPHEEPSEEDKAAQKEAHELLDSYLEEGETVEEKLTEVTDEPKEGEHKKIRRTVGGGELFGSFLHELLHMAMLGIRPPYISEEAMDPSLYARLNALERAAEVWVAMCLGREVSEEDRQAHQEVWDKVAAQREKYGHPLGPFVVTGVELDLSEKDALYPRLRTTEPLDVQFKKKPVSA